MRQRFVMSVLIVTMIVVGCAKRPAMLQVAAPPPTAGAATQPPPVPAPTPTVPPAATPPPAVVQPAAPSLPAPAQFRDVPALNDIYFDFDKSDIRPDAARRLDANINWMRSNPAALILIEGHCDERGTNEYNLALGDRRAKAALKYLVAHGIDETRITTISYGEERPVCLAHAETCWTKNRRAHFLTKDR